MRPQDIVAMILAVGVVGIMLSGTSLKLLFLDVEDVVAAEQNIDAELRIGFWKDIFNVILGALAGYIAGRGKNE